jgi:hypothetical protein
LTIDGSDKAPSLSLRSFRGPGVVIRIGRPFRFRRDASGRAGRVRLRQMTDEAMYLLAEMLPEHRRGVYADLSKATRDTIEFA